ncbi:MAG: hypothetical protein Ct9H300mP12_12200 [Acidimicrobiales bacterium]|nr:MAG: hypothetical protein Ct9H300mP12_12200 [Acidimicrobiales bacterium]
MDWRARLVPLVHALILAAAATGVVGLVIERLTIRPMIGEPIFRWQ